MNHLTNEQITQFTSLSESASLYVVDRDPVGKDLAIYVLIKHFPFSLIPFPFCEAGISTFVERPLQISSFLTNKANFLESQVNVTSFYTVDYENNSNWTLGENKPNQSQSKPIKANFRKAQNERNFCFNKGLQKKRRFRSPKKQSQFKPNQTQSNPISKQL